MFPALVAMANTPIVWDKEIHHFREITVKEAAKLQSFRDDFIFLGSKKQTFRQLGNAVNTDIAYQLARGLFNLRVSENER